MAEHPNAPRCHHVRTNGLRCGSPAMRNQKHCYYHRQASAPLPHAWEMPNLEDGNAIQLGIARVIRQLMLGGIEYKLAQLMISAYRLALRNLQNVDPESCWRDKVVTVDPDFDAANAGSVSEPITYNQEEKLTTEGTLSQRKAVASIRDRAEDTVGAGITREDQSVAEEKAFQHLSEKEREEVIMRLSKNEAYFLPEGKTGKRPPEPDLSVKDLLKEAREFASH